MLLFLYFLWIITAPPWPSTKQAFNMDEVGEWMIKQVLKPQQLINISLYFVTSHCLKHSNVDLNPIHWPSYEIIEQINFIKLIKSNFLLEWLHLPFFFVCFCEQFHYFISNCSFLCVSSTEVYLSFIYPKFVTSKSSI